MINKILQVVAPHHCYGCGKIGTLLCDNCKYDITDEVFDGCIVCERPSPSGICESCRTSYDRAWCVGDRTSTLEALINGLKFDRVKDSAFVLASLLDARLPMLPANTIIVPVPTVSSHIRQRGYDHSLLIARHLARMRRLQVSTCMARTSTTMQRGADKTTRLRQAETAFGAKGGIDKDATYLLVDDVVTTNATLRYAAHTLRDGGAQQVWAAVVARQPLDKRS